MQGRFAARRRGSYFAAERSFCSSGTWSRAASFFLAFDHLPLTRGRRPFPCGMTKIYLDLGRGGPWASCRQRPRSVGSDPQAQSLNRITCNFCKLRPQWAGRNRGKSLRFCAPEGLRPPQEVTPVNGGPGGSDISAESRSALAPLAVFWFLFGRPKGNSPPGRRTPRGKKVQANKEEPIP